MAIKAKRKSRKLVTGYLENIDNRVFSDFQKALKKLVGGQHGLYALYKGKRLYYVGLATNLKSRISQHLSDKHATGWDRFSLYLVQKVDHIRELESLVMRIADPKGNAAKGRLKHAENLSRELRRLIKAVQEEDLTTIFKSKIKKERQVKKTLPEKQEAAGKKQPSLLGIIKRTITLRASYKGQTYSAKARRTGRIFFNGKPYDTPTSAARAVSGKSFDGWYFWKFRDKDGNWVKLDVLRKH
jgi:hypothetical protein